MKSELLKRYLKEIQAQLQKELGLKNIMEVPRIEKICVNIGMGSHLQRHGTKDYSAVESSILRITGQKPMLKKARMSVSNFKLREGMPVGLHVTLRDDAAYNFLDKVINIVYPRVRGFEGVKNNIFDKSGNCSFGFKDHTVFPETGQDNPAKTHGVQVTIVTSNTDEAGTRALLKAMNFPFKKQAN